MKNIFFYSILLLLCACSTDPIEQTDELITSNFEHVLIPWDTDGYGIFSNEQFDAGWKRGFGDWAYQYNRTVQNYNYSACSNALIVTYVHAVGSSVPTATEDPRDFVKLETRELTNSFAIAQRTKNDFRSYYNNLFSTPPNSRSDWERGKIAGYLAYYGQAPLAANGGGCE